MDLLYPNCHPTYAFIEQIIATNVKIWNFRMIYFKLCKIFKMGNGFQHAFLRTVSDLAGRGLGGVRPTLSMSQHTPGNLSTPLEIAAHP